MCFPEMSLVRRESIWMDTSATWDEVNPDWKTVGKNPARVKRREADVIAAKEDLEMHVPLEQVFSCDRRRYKLIFASGREVVGISRELIPDDSYVIVEADRGEDCAVVQSQMDRETVIRGESATILRIATPKDIDILGIRKRQESRALVKCAALAKEHGCAMEVTRCEFQWDMRKITFYFKSSRRIDFRDLVKELFKYFKIRIWMSMENRS